MLEEYNEIWEKVSNNIKNEFDSEPVWNEIYLRTKIKWYEGKINSNFYNDKIPKGSSKYVCLSVILIYSVYATGKNYYPHVFLEECKYIVKEKKMPAYITDDTGIASDDSDEENSEKENSNYENSDEENSV